MANKQHVKVLKQGIEVWNDWRKKNPEIKPNLKSANLASADLRGADLHGSDLRGANLFEANLYEAKVHGADLKKAILIGANMWEADLFGADLSEANLTGAELFRALIREANLDKANLTQADLSHTNLGDVRLRGAILRDANLQEANLVNADLSGADLRGCSIYGISVWNITLDNKTKQSGLVITPDDTPMITVDNIEVAQFIYLLLNRQKLRDVIDTITSKAVLILGRFTPERKAVLDALANELRKYNLLPIIFDFKRSTNRDFTETIKILAGLSLFVIVDLTKPKSAPQELMATIPDYQIPFVPILEEGEDLYSMFVDFKKYDWVLKPLKYRSKEVLVEHFREAILERAWKKRRALQRKKKDEFGGISIEQMIKQKKTTRRGVTKP